MSRSCEAMQLYKQGVKCGRKAKFDAYCGYHKGLSGQKNIGLSDPEKQIKDLIKISRKLLKKAWPSPTDNMAKSADKKYFAALESALEPFKGKYENK